MTTSAGFDLTRDEACAIVASLEQSIRTLERYVEHYDGLAARELGRCPDLSRPTARWASYRQASDSALAQVVLHTGALESIKRAL